jgi:hypothetical protein
MTSEHWQYNLYLYEYLKTLCGLMLTTRKKEFANTQNNMDLQRESVHRITLKTFGKESKYKTNRQIIAYHL